MNPSGDRYEDLSAMKLPDIEQHVYIHPGQLYFTSNPTIVTTILGPCVSVCLFDLQTGTAGMNHYLLPSKFGPDSPRFAEVANELLLERFLEAQIPVSRLRAKVFGGAAMRAVKSDLAERNVAAAFAFLTARGIAVSAKDVGGERGRKLHFRTSDGAAWVRFL